MLINIFILLEWVLFVIASIIGLLGIIGFLRFKDFYNKIHAQSVIDTGFIFFIFLALLVASPNFLIAIKLIVLGVFISYTSLIINNMFVRASLLSNIKPDVKKTIEGK